jgi:hypothetical protein
MSLTPVDTARAARLRRSSARIAWMLTALLVVLPAAIALYVFGFPEAIPHHPWLTDLTINPALTQRPLAFGWSVAIFAVLLAGSVPRLFSIWAARRLFRDYAAGALFTPAATLALRRIAFGILASACVPPIGSTLLSSILRAAGLTDDFMLTLTTDQIWLAVLGFVILGIAQVMREAVAIAEDNAGIV